MTSSGTWRLATAPLAEGEPGADPSYTPALRRWVAQCQWALESPRAPRRCAAPGRPRPIGRVQCMPPPPPGEVRLANAAPPPFLCSTSEITWQWTWPPRASASAMCAAPVPHVGHRATAGGLTTHLERFGQHTHHTPRPHIGHDTPRTPRPHFGHNTPGTPRPRLGHTTTRIHRRHLGYDTPRTPRTNRSRHTSDTSDTSVTRYLGHLGHSTPRTPRPHLGHNTPLAPRPRLGHDDTLGHLGHRRCVVTEVTGLSVRFFFVYWVEGSRWSDLKGGGQIAPLHRVHQPRGDAPQRAAGGGPLGSHG